MLYEVIVTEIQFYRKSFLQIATKKNILHYSQVISTENIMHCRLGQNSLNMFRVLYRKIHKKVSCFFWQQKCFKFDE